MGWIWNTLRSQLDKCYFWLPSKFVTKPMANAMIGFADQEKGKHLERITRKQFFYRLGDTKLILLGTDSGTEDFIRKYRDRFIIHAVVSDNPELNGKKEYMGYDRITLSELEAQMDKLECTYVITSIYHYRVFSEFLEEHGTTYYSYPAIECGRLSHRIFRPFYLLRYRWLAFFTSRDAFWRNYVLFPAQAALRVLHLAPHHKRQRALRDLKNIHRGERCFIVATGPSLRVEDLERLKGEITFGVNSIFKIYEQTDWRPTYYALCDRKVFDQLLDSGNNLDFDHFSLKKTILTDRVRIKRLKNLPNEDRTIYVPFSYLNHLNTAIHVDQKYSTNPLWGLYNAQTVTNFAINMAQYMGFSEIYLLGVDFNYTTGAHHFDGSTCDYMLDEVIKQRTLDNTLDCYKMVYENTKKAGISVINVSRGSKLRVFPIANFDELPFLPAPKAQDEPVPVVKDALVESYPEENEPKNIDEETEAYEYMVSVIVLTYAHERFVRQALDSILKQKVNFKYEVLIGDDCSPDSTQEILREYESLYPDIFKITYRTVNVGPTKNAYGLFEQARGKYIANLEGDDYWTDPYKLQRQVDFLEEHPEFIATVHNCFIVDEDGHIIDRDPKQFSKSVYYTAKELETWTLPGQAATLVYRNIFLRPKHDYTAFYKIDSFLGDTTIMAILAFQGKFYKFPEVMSHYRRVYKSQSTSWSAISLYDRRFKIYCTMRKLQQYVRDEMHKTLNMSNQMEKIRYYLFVQYADAPTEHKREIVQQILTDAGDREKEYANFLKKIQAKTPLRKLKYRYYDWRKKHISRPKRIDNILGYLRRESDRQWKINYQRSILTRQKIDRVIAQNKAIHMALLDNRHRLEKIEASVFGSVQAQVTQAELIDSFVGDENYSLFYSELEAGKNNLHSVIENSDC